MAASSSFKQQCPSCEAMVPIRDPGLVGKKIDCPKCKYRFIVEEPIADEAAEEQEAAARASKGGKSTAVAEKKNKAKALPPRRRDDDEGDGDEGKGKSANHKTLYIGIGLGTVALAALIGGGILLFGGSPPTPSKGSGPPPNANAGTKTEQTKEETKPAEAGEAGGVADITNLLPNETQVLLTYDVEKVLNSSVKLALLEKPGTFSESAFNKTFGFPIENVKRILTALVPQGDAVFSVLRSGKSINREQLTKSLKLTPEKPINGFEYFTVHGDLDSLGALLVRACKPTAAKYMLHFYDGQTLVFADAGLMTKFLEDKRQPKFLTKLVLAAPKPAKEIPPAPKAPAKGNASALSFDGQLPIGVPANDNKDAIIPYQAVAPAAGVAIPGGPPATSGASRLGPAGTGPAAAPLPGGPGKPAAEPEPTLSAFYMTVDPALKIVMDRLERDKGTALFSAAGVFASAPAVPDVANNGIPHSEFVLDRFLRPQLKPLEWTKAGGIAVHEFNENTAISLLVLEAKAEDGVEPLEKGLESVAKVAVELMKANWSMDVKSPTASPTRRPAGGVPLPGAAPLPGGVPLPGGAFPGGVGPRIPGRVAGGAEAGPGRVPGGAASSNANVGEDGAFVLSVRDKTVALGADLKLKRPVYDQLIVALSVLMVQLKGEADLVSNRPRVHDLARALMGYVKAKNEFPRGALHRPPSSERGIDWYPEQRLSWFVELLPYVGDGEAKDLLRDPKLSWTEGDNLLTSQVIVPQFLAGNSPKDVRVRYPGRTGRFAATNFVGVAGIGLDAATYPSNNAAFAKKVGVFGYDRVTKLDDLKDGADSTIAVLQMPPIQNTPWMAGGGSTVRGVSDDADALKPFVCVEYKGKKGTFAIMCDGKVRFLAEDMPVKTFHALCTVGGGEQITDLDEAAPVVAEEGMAEPKVDADAAKTTPVGKTDPVVPKP